MNKQLGPAAPTIKLQRTKQQSKFELCCDRRGYVCSLLPFCYRGRFIRERSERVDHQAEINQAWKRTETGQDKVFFHRVAEMFNTASLYHLKAPRVPQCCTGDLFRKPILS